MGHLLELEKLFAAWKNNSPDRIEPLNNTSASPRLYFRVYSKNETYIGAYNADLKENKAFFHFTETFKKAGIQVPQLYFVSDNESYYLIEDIGDTNLLSILKVEGETDYVKSLYKKAIDQLLKMQLYDGSKIDFKTFAYPTAEFDTQSVLWDLNHFKYYFLKLSGLPFDEQLLENDFIQLAKKVSNQNITTFMFRDFQARNIQVHQNEVWLLDYQGGRKGPVLYDLVSLLYQASAQLSFSLKEELKNYYKLALQQKYTIFNETFEQDFVSMVFIRIIQTLGTYGLRGLIEKKAYFVESIPLALENLENIIQSEHFKLEIPYFINLIGQLLQLKSKFVSK